MAIDMQGRPAASALGRAIWLQLLIAFGAFIFIGSQDGAVGVLLPSLQRQYDLNKSTVSTLFFASTCGYLIAAFSSGLLVEALGRRRFLTLGALCLLLGQATIATAPAWYVVLSALVAVGFGVAALDAGLNAYVAGLPNNTALLNYLHAFYGAGALLGPLLASTVLAAALGWNMVYVVLASGALLLALGFAVTFRGARGTSRAQPASVDLGTARQPNVMSATLALPIVWVAAVFLLLYVGVEVSIGSWAYSYLTEERDEAALLSGWLVSSYWAGLTVGRMVLGSVTRKLGDAMMIQLCLAGLVLGLLLLWLVPGTAAAALGLALAGFALGPIFPTMIAAISGLVPARLLPSAIGFMTSLGAAGAAMFPWLAGILSNMLGVWVVLPYAIVISVVIIGLWLLFQSLAAGRRSEAVEGAAS